MHYPGSGVCKTWVAFVDGMASQNVMAMVFYNPRSSFSYRASTFKRKLKIWVFTLTQQYPLKSRRLKHARLVFSIFLDYSGFSYYWDLNHICSNSWLPTRFLQLSPGWHIRLISDLPSACQEYSCSSDCPKLWFCRMAPVLSDLHWLPVCHRNSIKIATVTFRVLQFQQP